MEFDVDNLAGHLRDQSENLGLDKQFWLGIAGTPGSGKSTLSQALVDRLVDGLTWWGDETSVQHHIDEMLFNLLPQIERYEGRVRFSRHMGDSRQGSSSDHESAESPAQMG